MTTMDQWFLELQISKLNFDGLIMQLEQIFGESLLFSVCPYLKLMFSKVIKNLSTINWFIAGQTQPIKNRP